MMYRYWFANVNGIGEIGKLRILERCGNEEALYKMPEAQIRRLEEIGCKQADLILESRRSWRLQEAYESFLASGLRLVSWSQEQYPDRLRTIYQPPYSLYYRGTLPENGIKAVAVVGARACSEYGRVTAEKIGEQLARAGIQVISGLALGVDAAAQWGAVKAGGGTFSVMGSGADVCYPAANRRLYREVARTGGILSEYPAGTNPKPGLFPKRNRIISGLSDAVILVEAKERSGSLITADFALEQGREVYAVPGRTCDALSAGTNRLISQGAGIFLSVEEFLRDTGLGAPGKTDGVKNIELALEKNERLVYSVLDLTPKNLERLLNETGLDLRGLTGILTVLLRRGLAEEVYKNYFIRI